jgi:GTP-binding protein
MVADAQKRIRNCQNDGIVVEGRDVTTVIAPDAQLRILLTADERVRMARRAGETEFSSEQLTETVSERDAKDSALVDFMKPAKGVELLDSTTLSFDHVVDRVLELVEHVIDDDEFEDEEFYKQQLEEFDLDEEDLDLLDRELQETGFRPPPPVVAIVGRPNVGKSALVNKILGRREAVVKDEPGITRDRVSYRAEWNDKEYTLVDTGGWEVDVKGLEASIAGQAEVAVELSDAVLFVVDSMVGATASDERVVRMLRKAGKPVYLVANKVDDERLDPADLLDAVTQNLPEHSQVADEIDTTARRVALIGRPNVGKSSLLNKATGINRAVVSDIAGTTRDPIDEQVEIGGKAWRFIDTAGIRRRTHRQFGADFYASLRTAAALERAEVAVVLIDANEAISEADIRIIQLALDSGRALVIAFNKWDTLDDERRYYLEKEIETELAHVSWAPRVNISALTGRHLEKLVPALELALASWEKRISTGKFNGFIQELQQANPHPLRGGKQPRILFGTQAATKPPKFVLFSSGFLEAGYRRYVIRRLRETYGFMGSPVEIGVRVRERRKKR